MPLLLAPTDMHRCDCFASPALTGQRGTSANGVLFRAALERARTAVCRLTLESLERLTDPRSRRSYCGGGSLNALLFNDPPTPAPFRRRGPRERPRRQRGHANDRQGTPLHRRGAPPDPTVSPSPHYLPQKHRSWTPPPRRFQKRKPAFLSPDLVILSLLHLQSLHHEHSRPRRLGLRKTRNRRRPRRPQAQPDKKRSVNRYGHRCRIARIPSADLQSCGTSTFAPKHAPASTRMPSPASKKIVIPFLWSTANSNVHLPNRWTNFEGNVPLLEPAKNSAKVRTKRIPSSTRSDPVRRRVRQNGRTDGHGKGYYDKLLENARPTRWFRSRSMPDLYEIPMQSHASSWTTSSPRTTFYPAKDERTHEIPPAHHRTSQRWSERTRRGHLREGFRSIYGEVFRSTARDRKWLTVRPPPRRVTPAARYCAIAKPVGRVVPASKHPTDASGAVVQVPCPRFRKDPNASTRTCVLARVSSKRLTLPDGEKCFQSNRQRSYFKLGRKVAGSWRPTQKFCDEPIRRERCDPILAASSSCTAVRTFPDESWRHPVVLCR